MAKVTEVKPQRQSLDQQSGMFIRLALATLGLVATLAVIWFGFVFLRDNQETVPKLASTIIAIIWGVGGVAALFITANFLVEQLGDTAKSVLRPFIFVGPAVFMLGWFLFIPTVRTLYLSFYSADSLDFVGIQNYIFAFTDRTMLESFRNNLLWMFFGTSGCIVFGLTIAVLADRSKFETVAKALIFMPMAISFVGAGVIWRFIYYYAPPGETQIGLLNAAVTWLGGEPKPGPAWFSRGTTCS